MITRRTNIGLAALLIATFAMQPLFAEKKRPTRNRTSATKTTDAARIAERDNKNKIKAICELYKNNREQFIEWHFVQSVNDELNSGIKSVVKLAAGVLGIVPAGLGVAGTLKLATKEPVMMAVLDDDFDEPMDRGERRRPRRRRRANDGDGSKKPWFSKNTKRTMHKVAAVTAGISTVASLSLPVVAYILTKRFLEKRILIRQLSTIIDNLEAYRPVIPQRLLPAFETLAKTSLQFRDTNACEVVKQIRQQVLDANPDRYPKQKSEQVSSKVLKYVLAGTAIMASLGIFAAQFND